MVTSAETFIEAKGVEVVAKATARSPGAVRVWKCRNRFPQEAWLQLSVAFPELTLDVLQAITPPTKKDRAQRPRRKAA